MEKKVKPECIYIATRLSAGHPLDYLSNLDESINVSIEVWEKGHYPFVPGLDYVYLMRMRNIKMSQIYANGLEWVRRCDSILIHNGLLEEPYSPGVKAEYEVALEENKKVYWSADEILEVTE